jgi:hypothetical protein
METLRSAIERGVRADGERVPDPAPDQTAATRSSDASPIEDFVVVVQQTQRRWIPDCGVKWRATWDSSASGAETTDFRCFCSGQWVSAPRGSAASQPTRRRTPRYSTPGRPGPDPGHPIDPVHVASGRDGSGTPHNNTSPDGKTGTSLIAYISLSMHFALLFSSLRK